MRVGGKRRAADHENGADGFTEVWTATAAATGGKTQAIKQTCLLMVKGNFQLRRLLWLISPAEGRTRLWRWPWLFR